MNKWKSGLEVRDVVIADSIFKPLVKELNAISGWKSSKNHNLEDWKKEENRQVSLTRGSF